MILSQYKRLSDLSGVSDSLQEKTIDEARAEIANLRREIKDEDYRLLPLSYIANHYFKKSAAWLSQRINGTPVRGKVYTLNSEQKHIFNQAVREIGQKIGSFQLV